MASAYVQTASKENQATATPDVTITGVSEGSTLLIAVVRTDSNGRTVSSVGGTSVRNAWAVCNADREVLGCNTLAVWYTYNVAAGNYTPVVTMNASGTYSVVVVEISGVTTTDPKDKVASATAASTTSITVGPTDTTSQNAELCVLFLVGQITSRVMSAPSGWDSRLTLNTYALIYAYTKSQSTAAAQSATSTTSLNQNMIGAISTWKDAAAAATPLPVFLNLQRQFRN